VAVDPRRLGIWGSSYGGFLTTLALARNSDVFKTGVDIYGVTDWSAFIALYFPPPGQRFDTDYREQAFKTAWLSSPLADMAHWRSPILVIHGDEDQIVPYADAGPLSAKLVKNAILKTYKGFPHGMPTTQADTINADLLAFIKS